MAQPHVKVTERGNQTVIAFHEGIGKATRCARVVVLENPTREQLAASIGENLTELRVKLGKQGRLIDD